jgi:hypothetical protein
MKKMILQLLFLFSGSFACAQAPAIGWQKAIGGSLFDEATGIIQSADSNFLMIGISLSTDGDLTVNKGMYDAWVSKLSKTGNIMWQKTFGGSQSDYTSDIQQTSDGGYIVAGYSKSSDGDVTNNHGSIDAWIIKLSPTGSMQWQKTYGGSSLDVALSIRQTSDGGYIFAGWSFSGDGDLSSNHGDSDAWVVKLNSTGAISWTYSLGGSDKDHASAIAQTSDGGYIVGGAVRSSDFDITSNSGGFDYTVYKLSPTGSLQWKRFFGGSGYDFIGDHSIAGSILQTPDGGYLTVGASNSNDGDVTGNHGFYDSWIIRLDDTGGMTWQKSLGGSLDDQTYSLQQTQDTGYVISGTSNSSDGQVSGGHGGYDFWIFKINSGGNLIWQQCYGGAGYEVAFKVQPTYNGNFIAAGFSNDNSGQVSGVHGDYDAWVTYLAYAVDIPELSSNSAIGIFPNPGSGIFTIRGVVSPNVKVYNTFGQPILQSVASTTISISDLPDGLYTLYIYDQKGMFQKSEKIVKQN